MSLGVPPLRPKKFGDLTNHLSRALFVRSEGACLNFTSCSARLVRSRTGQHMKENMIPVSFPTHQKLCVAGRCEGLRLIYTGTISSIRCERVMCQTRTEGTSFTAHKIVQSLHVHCECLTNAQFQENE